MAVATTEGMDDDLRYARPCRWLLAVGAGINWVAAMLVISGRSEVVSASELAQAIEPLLNSLVRALI
jgi:hypothetical protein